ncbi:uncharacterized protein [Medicago truncatula]|uniref:uncharacterized protein n=1 Tax=Medicago truncatula TaxID=3880 RepID=UPI000D2F4340|nr:uncharacterized protein LOC112420960 [Medicago truncatula]
MNFPTLWRKWMAECMATATASVLVNGCPTEEFTMERGLRQGDPLSPFLFLLAAEGFHILMVSLIQAGLFNGYRVGRENTMCLSHLQFADDTLIIGEKIWLNVRSMRAVLLLFEQVSELKVNFHKSLITGVNVTDSWLYEASLILNFRVGTLPFVYLGLPIGRDPRKLEFWRPLLDIIRTRLSNWKGWDTVCLLKKEGGLGVRRMREFNVALLGKWCWCMLIDRDGLWYRVLKVRYGEEGGRLKEGGGDSSVWWRMLCGIRRGAGLGEGSWFEDNVSTLDRWRWMLDPIGGYSVKGTYKYLTLPTTPVETSLYDAAWLKQVPLKVYVFVWRLLRNRLPTKDNLLRRRAIHHDDIFVWEGVAVQRHRIISSSVVILLAACGFMSTSGSTFCSYLQTWFVTTSISLVI